MTTAWKPVLVPVAKGKEVRIANSDDALRFMDERPDLTAGGLFQRARKHCLASIEDPTATSRAELAFRAAVVNLGMLPDTRKSPMIGTVQPRTI